MGFTILVYLLSMFLRTRVTYDLFCLEVSPYLIAYELFIGLNLELDPVDYYFTVPGPYYSNVLI